MRRARGAAGDSGIQAQARERCTCYVWHCWQVSATRAVAGAVRAPNSLTHGGREPQRPAASKQPYHSPHIKVRSALLLLGQAFAMLVCAVWFFCSCSIVSRLLVCSLRSRSLLSLQTISNKRCDTAWCPRRASALSHRSIAKIGKRLTKASDGGEGEIIVYLSLAFAYPCARAGLWPPVLYCATSPGAISKIACLQQGVFSTCSVKM